MKLYILHKTYKKYCIKHRNIIYCLIFDLYNAIVHIRDAFYLTINYMQIFYIKGGVSNVLLIKQYSIRGI